jgi:hypothetical protein
MAAEEGAEFRPIADDIGGDVADAPLDIDQWFDIFLDFLHHERGEIVGPIVGEGDLPFDERLDDVLKNPAVQESIAQKVSDAQAAGRAIPMPSAREFAAARDRHLARRSQA